MCLLCPPLGKEFLSPSKLTKKNTSRWRWKKKKTKKGKEKYGNYLLGSPLCFCLFVFSLKKKAQFDSRTWQLSIFCTKNCSRSNGSCLLHSQFLPTLPPLPSLSLCLNSPSYESHRTIFTGLGAKSQVMTGYLPLPKPWTLKLTKICIFFDEIIHTFTCTFFAPVCYHMVWD